MFRTDSLTRPLDREELSALRSRRRDGDFGPGGHGWIGIVIVAAVFVMVGTMMVNMVGSMVGRMGGRGGLSPFVIVWLAMFAFIVFTVIRQTFGSIRGRDNWAKLARFADENGLSYRLHSKEPWYPGLLFSLGHSQAAVNHLVSPHGPVADVGTFRYVTGSGKNKSTHTWNYAAFRLPAHMPHLVLDAKSNNVAGLSNLPVSFDRTQRLSLGSPFDDRYTLYAPGGYQQDSFYLFPPHVLEELLNLPVDYDVEIVDNWMFLYTRSSQDLTDPAVWRAMESVAEGLVARMAPVAQRYRDRRVEAPQAAALSAPRPVTPGQPTIAPEGRRLRRGFDWGIVAMVIGFLIYWFLLRH